MHQKKGIPTRITRHGTVGEGLVRAEWSHLSPMKDRVRLDRLQLRFKPLCPAADGLAKPWDYLLWVFFWAPAGDAPVKSLTVLSELPNCGNKFPAMRALDWRGCLAALTALCFLRTFCALKWCFHRAANYYNMRAQRAI